MGVSNMTLVKIASLGGMATVSMGLLARGKVQQNMKETLFYKDALKATRSHPAAVHLLGEPIKDKRIHISNTDKNLCMGNEVQYEVSLKGSKQKGVLHFWVNKPNEEGQWIVKRIELALQKEPEKRLVLRQDNGNAT